MYIQTGKRYDISCPVSQLVLNAIASVEDPLDAAVPVHSYHSADLLFSLQIALKDAYPTHDSFSELIFYVIRIFAAISVLLVLIFLFHHD
jgi:hypothetical protein